MKCVVWTLAGVALGATAMLLLVRHTLRSDEFGDKLARELGLLPEKP